MIAIPVLIIGQRSYFYDCKACRCPHAPPASPAYDASVADAAPGAVKAGGPDEVEPNGKKVHPVGRKRVKGSKLRLAKAETKTCRKCWRLRDQRRYPTYTPDMFFFLNAPQA